MAIILEGKVEARTVTNRAILEGVEALTRLAAQKDEKGQPFSAKLSYPMSRNLRLLRDDYESLVEARRRNSEGQAQLAHESAIKGRDGAVLQTIAGIALKDPAAFRAKRDLLVLEWKEIETKTVEVRVLPIAASLFGKVEDFNIAADDLDALITLGVLVWDHGEPAEKK